MIVQDKVESTPMIYIADANGESPDVKDGSGLTDAESVVRPSSQGNDLILSELTMPSSTPMAGEAAQANGGVSSNGASAHEARDSSGNLPPSHSSVRSTSNSSTKFASLRAAFERNGSADSTTQRRLASSGEKANERGKDRSQEYEKEVARLRDELEKEKELRHAYEEKCTALEEEGEVLREQLEQRDEMWKTEWARKSSSLVEQQSQALVLEVKKSRDQTGALQQQLSEMKRSISTSTRIDSEVTDSTLTQEMEVLHHEIQNWIVNNFRRAKTDISSEELCARLDKVTESEQLEALKPVYAAFNPGMKLAIYQATAMAYLIEIFDAPLLYGLPADQDWRKRLRQAFDSLPAFLSAVAYNKWRSVTLDLVRQSPETTQWIDAAALGMTELICIALSTLTEVEGNDARRVSLNSIVRRAISLAHLFRVQRAQYEFSLPTPGADFNRATMDGLSADVEAQPGSRVVCATFPSVVKLGDAQGDNMHLRNVVLKAKTICSES